MKNKKPESKKAKISYGEHELPEGALDPKNMKVRITSYFDLDALDEVRKLAAARNIGYQTLLNEIVRKAVIPSVDPIIDAISSGKSSSVNQLYVYPVQIMVRELENMDKRVRKVEQKLEGKTIRHEIEVKRKRA